MRRVAVVVALSTVLASTVGAQGVVGGRIGGTSPGLPSRDVLTAPPTGSARLGGRVLSTDGTALKRAQVMLSGAGVSLRRTTTTDGNGRYEFADLPAGRFTIAASKAGYVEAGYGQKRPGDAVTPVSLGEDDRLTNINISLQRGGVISGRITDEFGEPVAGAQVQAFKFQYQPDGQRRLSPTSGGGFMQTDDLGQFRAYGLLSGDYVVNASVRSFPFGGSSAFSSDRNEGYPPTYYPGTLDQRDAQTIAVAAGQESSIQFSLVPATMSRISGTITDSQRRPAVGANVSIRSVGPFAFAMGVPVAPDGAFTISSVPPGEHVIDVRLMRPDGASEVASVPVTTAGVDLTGVHIATASGAMVAGRVVFEGSVPRTVGQTRPRVFAQSTAPLALPPMMSQDPAMNGTIQDDGTFVLAGLSGSVLLTVSPLPPGTMVKSVTIDGANVTAVPVDVTPGGSSTDVRIVVTDRITVVSGRAVDSRGAPAKDYMVIVVPAEQKAPGAQARFIRIARSSTDGGFDIRGMLPERYVAAAIADVEMEPGQQFSPEFQDRVRRAGRAFSLRDGENVSLELSLSSGL